MLYRFIFSAFIVSSLAGTYPAKAEDAAYDGTHNITLPGIPGLVHSAERTIPARLLPDNMPVNSFIRSTGSTQIPFDVFNHTGRKIGSLRTGTTTDAPFTFRAAMN